MAEERPERWGQCAAQETDAQAEGTTCGRAFGRRLLDLFSELDVIEYFIKIHQSVLSFTIIFEESIIQNIFQMLYESYLIYLVDKNRSDLTSLVILQTIGFCL